MVRGTTAQFKFNLPCTKGELEWVTIKFWQPNNPNIFLPITKKLEHCAGNDDIKALIVSLTPEETARFLDKYKAKTQLRARRAINGTVFGSKPISIIVEPMDEDMLEENPILPSEDEDGFIFLDGKTVAEDTDEIVTFDGYDIAE